MVVGILVLLPLSKIFLDGKTDNSGQNKHKHKSLDKLVSEYNLKNYLSVCRVTDESLANGRSVAELDVHNRFGLSIIEIRREQTHPGGIIKNVKQKVASAKSVLKTGDILYLAGENENIKAFASKYSLEKLPSADMDFYDIGIAEIVLMPGSSLVNSLLKDSSLREKYNVNVLGIRRSGDYIIKNLANEKLHIGDVLLVQGSWKNISQLDTYDDWVVMGQPSEQEGTVLLDYKAPLAALIMLLMICMMVFDFIPVNNVTAIMIAGLLMVLTGCLRNVDAAYKTIKWESVVLIAAMMPMSIALQKTGTSELISSTLVNWLQSSGPVALLAGLYFTTSLMTMFISNTATAVLMAPIALSAATQVGVSPYPFLFAVTLGASMCFASPFSTPPNALVMKAGNYSFMDYVKVGLPLQLIMGLVMIFVLPCIFPF
jgi:di/tricarboxylate transporter